MKARCHYCGKIFETKTGYYNRAMQMGNNVYCSRKHAGLGRRVNRSEEEEKFIKYFYDAFINLADEERFKKERREWFEKDYAAHPEKYRQRRKRRQKEHNEYCRQPQYRKWKKVYDQQYRAKRLYGEFWESAIALRKLADIVDNRLAKSLQKNITKSQKRKRNANKNTKRKELESCTMGFYQPG